MSRRMFFPGDPAPHFKAPASNNPNFHFGSVAGRYIVLSFLGSLAEEKAQAVAAHIHAMPPHYLDDVHASFFGVTTDPADEAEGRAAQRVPGIRYFWDFDRRISTLYGAEFEGACHPFTLVLDPFLRVVANISLVSPQEHNRALDFVFSKLPPVEQHAGVPLHAPVLILPRVFEPEFCKQLIGLYEANGGTESGFMREKDGKTVGVLDHQFKRRADYYLEDQELMSSIRARLTRRLLPEIQKTFQFAVTRMERYVVACYDGQSGGFFRPHRDNTTKGTAHRRFAVTINLNAHEYEGGDLRFPEFGSRTYRAPTGGAVVFSCSLLHEATPVRKGKRYAFLPFLYDDEAARIREDNRQYLTGEMIDLNQERL